MTIRSLAVGLALSASLVIAPAGSYGQSTALTPFDKLPDWSGTWAMTGGTVFDRATQTGKGGSIDPGVREHPPYNAVYEKKYAEHLKLRDEDRYPDVQTNCGVPSGFPRILNLPDAYEFVVRPDVFYIIAENGGNTMRVYTDGRKLPGKEDTWGTYTGVSVGHWQGDTLLIDTVGIKENVRFRNVPHSDQMRIHERIHMASADFFEDRITVEDPVYLTGPWNFSYAYKRLPHYKMLEYVCDSNREYKDPETGGTRLRLLNDPAGTGKKQ